MAQKIIHKLCSLHLSVATLRGFRGCTLLVLHTRLFHLLFPDHTFAGATAHFKRPSCSQLLLFGREAKSRHDRPARRYWDIDRTSRTGGHARHCLINARTCLAWKKCVLFESADR